MEQTMIKTENVSKRFGSFALQDIHFELPAGYICGLIGENGVGKTTGEGVPYKSDGITAGYWICVS